MASKPLRPCRKIGCAALTLACFCDKHRPTKQRGVSETWHWMYSTKVWTKGLRPGQLLREPFCRECAAEGKRVRAVAADHIKPHRGDWSLFTDLDNLQSLCKHHHDAKTVREMMQNRRYDPR